MAAPLMFMLALAGQNPAYVAPPPAAGFRTLFDGKTLDGWTGDAKYWRVENGVIVGSHEGHKPNEFLSTHRRYRNFVLHAEFKLVGGRGNSGIQFRSNRVPKSTEMKGYQADVGEGWWGCLYDESRRNKVLARPAKPEALAKALKKDDWNEYTIRTLGNRIELAINGVQTVAYDEAEAVDPQDGMFGLQVHGDAKPTRAEFRNLRIQELPDPQPDAPGAEGFVIRTSEIESRKYVAYVPKGYGKAGDKKWPCVLFLHGSGERGTDGVKQALVGLGPAIAARPDFPMFAVFPQARQTWKADSADSNAGLAALDEMLRAYRIDAAQVHVTGLSMGGNGTWEVAVRDAKMFASATVVCGFGDASGAAKLGKLPLRMFCGDRDMKFILDSTRQIEGKLKELGRAEPCQWYPGVGHNCWDHAYNTDELYAWMAKQRRAKE